ncbi:hypothetical protein [Actinoplanes derwentensis]|uniref:SUKH-4 immunity protein n=1 Tax=Actinoplanes derwentensis TaxID=113562 RepID=A0A1H2DAS9_9ACTN|nr:hypothetical protein [Actinoplanes derwentensis]GID81795.1 hypothetical protein Ade03nite_07190 [Actinoplanes derwentensis]SDT79865.1 hypothetical protein SAMN04489716_8963 [Actinoplanes derwentensis]
MTLTPDDLIGYVERDLDADIARWFPDAERAEVPVETRSIDRLVGLLPASGAAALTAFDQRVRVGRVPAVFDVSDWSYGFDFAGNDCGIVAADYETEISGDDVFTLAADGSGNLWTLLADGQVAVWFHEEEVLEEGTRFDHLDVFLWSLVRYHAVRQGRLSLAEVKADFLALGQGGMVAPELGMLTYLKD